MARRVYSSKTEYDWDAGEANPKQKLFFESRKLYTAYGGAKGGGKTWAVRTKALLGAYYYDGIKILIIRKTYQELQTNHIEPMLRMIHPEISSYNGALHTIYFENDSLIHFGHWNGDMVAESEYAGQEYDWIFIDEATQFTWRAFQYIGGMLRGVNDFPKRMYITCNPGGVGHRWVKRLFIDREFITGKENHEENEIPDEYMFIPATIEDNTALMESSPGYVRMLSSMPENLRNAYRYGNWDSLGGNYFPEFADGIHVIEPFAIPAHWRRYRAFDYGLDMFACAWFAVDEDGRSYLYREYSASNLIVKDAAQQMLAHTLPNERIDITFAPPDIWSRQKDSGKTMAELFMASGTPIVRADNNRVQGHMVMKEMFALKADGKPSLLVFRDCKETIDDIKDIQSDDKNPNDCAKDPHDVTHRVDAVRYYCINRVMAAELARQVEETDDDEIECGYDDYMTGGAASTTYMNYGGN